MNVVPIKPNQQPAPAHPRMERAIAAMCNALEPDGVGHALAANAAPNEDQRAFLTRRAAEISSWLTPATPQEVLTELTRLLRMMATQGGSEAELTSVIASYVEDLGNIPAPMLREACARFRRGDVGEGRFAPKAGELRKEALRLAGPWIAERSKITRVLNARVLPAIPNQRGDVMAHVRETARQLQAASIAQGGKGKAEPAAPLKADGAPMTASEAAELKLAEIAAQPFCGVSDALRKSMGLA